jgi:hypothetical protein
MECRRFEIEFFYSDISDFLSQYDIISLQEAWNEDYSYCDNTSLIFHLFICLQNCLPAVEEI